MARRGRAEGSVYQRHDHPSCPPPVDGVRTDHKCRGRWVGVVDLGQGGTRRQRKTMYGATRKEAATKVQRALEQKRSHTLVAGQAPTVETWMNYWLDEVCPERGTKVNTMKSYRSKVRQYIIPELGNLRLDRLQPEHVRSFYNKMRREMGPKGGGLSESTVRQTHAILRRALVVAQREGKVNRNVATLIDPPSTVRNKRTGLTLAQAEHVLTDAPLRWWVALVLGLRQGEALALRWSAIDLEEGYLRVEQNLVRQPGRGLILDTPKSQASIRTVPLPDVLHMAFRKAWAQHVVDGGTPDGFVFHHGGKPIDHRADWQAWSEWLAHKGVPHIALHAARNTAASLLEGLGYPARMVAEILGQATVEVTHSYQSAEYARRHEALSAFTGAIHALPAPPHSGERGRADG